MQGFFRAPAAARVNAKALSTYVGHGSVSMTFDRCGDSMPGKESEAADLLEAYLACAAAPRDNRATVDPQPVRPSAVEGGSSSALESATASQQAIGAHFESPDGTQQRCIYTGLL
jgi:hypothetical protein